MTENMAPARARGFVVALLLIAVSIAAAMFRFVSGDVAPDSLFLISQLAPIGGGFILARVLRPEPNRIDVHG